MKNIKKSLALVLAFVMILGLCTIGAGATFNDAKSINKTYSTAVEVMAGMGILAGSDDDGDGNFDFNPTGNVTRAQAAKMITYMILGKDAAEKLPAKAMFDDVKATDWSAKYVYYLANKGIINGYGDGKFGPNDSVTATQLAKMLLAACGYGKADEFVGSGWDVNVFATANDLGIFKDSEAGDFDIAATREEAAMYVFNTMTNVNLVNYNTDDGVYNEKLTNGKVVKYADSKYNYGMIEGVITGVKESGSSYTELTYSYEYYAKSSDTTLTKEKKTIQLNINIPSAKLGHKVAVYYNTKAETDDKRKTYYNAYFVEDLSTESFTFWGKFKDMYNALGGSNMSISPYSSDKDTANPSVNFTYWVNGINATYNSKPYTTTNYGDYFVTTYAKDKIAAKAKIFPLESDTFGLIGNFIIDDDGITIGFKETSTTMDRVIEVNTKAGSEYIKLEHKPLGSTTNTLENNATTDIVDAYEGIAKGDIVNISLSGNVYKLTKAQVVKDVYVNNLSADILGNLTKINGTYNQTAATSTSLPNTVVEKGTYNLYLDLTGSYGYAEPVDEAVKDLAFVAYAYYENKGVSKYYHAAYVDQDGTIKDSIITKATFDFITGTATPVALETVKVEKLYGVKTKADSTSYNTKETVAEFSDVCKSKPNTTLQSSYRIELGDSKNYYLSSETLYIYVTVDNVKNKITVTTSNSKPALDDTCNVYFYPAAINSSTVNFNVKTVFITGAKPASVAGTSFIYSSANDANTFRYSNIGSTNINTDGEIDYFLRAFVEAEYKTDIKISTDMAGLKDSNGNDISADNKYLDGGFYSYTVDGDGYYTLDKYTGADDNRVIDCKKITSLYNGKLSTEGDPTVNVDALNVSDATIIDFTKYSIQSLDELQTYVDEGYKVYISCWSYDYDNYLTKYGAGNSYAKTGVIYINMIEKP